MIRDVIVNFAFLLLRSSAKLTFLLFLLLLSLLLSSLFRPFVNVVPSLRIHGC